jgi:hypothetical protein
MGLLNRGAPKPKGSEVAAFSPTTIAVADESSEKMGGGGGEFGLPPTDEMALKWWNLIPLEGAGDVMERIQGYYDNVAIIAALMAAGAFTVLTAPPDDPREDPLAKFSAGLGSVAFAGYTFVTILCVMMTNKLRLVPHGGGGEAEFRGIIRRYQWIYRKPERLFVYSTIFLFGQLYTYVYLVYGVEVLAVSCVAILGGFAWLLVLYLTA